MENLITARMTIPVAMGTNFLFFIITQTISSFLKQEVVLNWSQLVMRQHQVNVNHNAHFKNIPIDCKNFYPCPAIAVSCLILEMLIKLFTPILLFISVGLKAQQKKVIVDASSNKPIEFVNVVAPKFRKGLISNKEGEIIWNVYEVGKEDTIWISHVSYEPRYLSFVTFQKIDTIALNAKSPTLPEVLVKQGIDISLYRNKRTLGYFQNKYAGGIYLRPGQQLGIRINNTENIDGLISELKLNFEKLLPNATLRIRFKRNNDKEVFSEDLLPNGIIIKPTRLKTTINLTGYKILLPPNGIFVDIEYLGDGNVYQNWMDAPYIIYKKTQRYKDNNTYNNYMNAYKWNKWNSIIKNEKNPSNAQVQIIVLSK